MRWFERNVEDSLRHWFGSLTVVYDDDPALAATASAAKGAAKSATAATKGAVAKSATAAAAPTPGQGDSGKQQQRYMFGFQPHGLYPTGREGRLDSQKGVRKSRQMALPSSVGGCYQDGQRGAVC